MTNHIRTGPGLMGTNAPGWPSDPQREDREGRLENHVFFFLEEGSLNTLRLWSSASLGRDPHLAGFLRGGG